MRKITAALLLLSAFCVIILLVTRVLPQTQRQPVRRAKQTRPTPDRSAGRLNVETDIPDSEQDWRLATESDEKPSGDSMAVYYNKRTLTHPSPGIVRVWVKYVDVMNNEEQLSHNIALEEFECASQRNRILSATQYDAEGKVKGGGSASRTPAWEYIIPDSVANGLFDIFCNGHEDMEHFYIVLAREKYSEGLEAERERRYNRALDDFKAALGYVPNGYNLKIQAAINRVNSEKYYPVEGNPNARVFNSNVSINNSNITLDPPPR